jgi:hypothetical protein
MWWSPDEEALQLQAVAAGGVTLICLLTVDLM